MRKARSKHESLRLMIAVGDARPTKRVVFTPWSKPESCRQTLGKFSLDAQGQQVRVWLPEGVVLDYLQFSRYTPPKVAGGRAHVRTDCRSAVLQAENLGEQRIAAEDPGEPDEGRECTDLEAGPGEGRETV